MGVNTDSIKGTFSAFFFLLKRAIEKTRKRERERESVIKEEEQKDERDEIVAILLHIRG